MQLIHTHNRTVGLLGGSFNPSHAGHLHISRYALKKLNLDELWWLVSPHNPLKDKNTLADYRERFASARKMTAGEQRIHVSDLEAQMGTQYTYQTIRQLMRRFPRLRFVWLMGADNLAGFHRWQRWDWLLEHVPIVVFDRVPFSHTAMVSPAALRARRFLLKDKDIGRKWPSPSLHFVRLKRTPESSTAIRKSLEKRCI